MGGLRLKSIKATWMASQIISKVKECTFFSLKPKSAYLHKREDGLITVIILQVSGDTYLPLPKYKNTILLSNRISRDINWKEISIQEVIDKLELVDIHYETNEKGEYIIIR